MSLTSTAALSKTIRDTLKKVYGITQRQVSIRTHNYSMGSSIYVDIHDPAVDIKEVENVANPKEAVRRDENNEILSGGNRFVFVKYSDKARAALQVQPTVAALIQALITGEQPKGDTSGKIVESEGNEYALTIRDGFRLCLMQWHDGAALMPTVCINELTPDAIAHGLLCLRGRA